MTPISSGHSGFQMHPILGSIRSTSVQSHEIRPATAVLPFITISRQAGAGGHTLAKLLAQRLDANLGEQDRRWQCFDRELVEKVVADHKIAEELIHSLEDSSHTWLEELVQGFSLRSHATPSETAIFQRVAATVRALAQAGRVILVGCAAGFITTHMPGGIHLRLVARFAHRVATMSRQWDISLDEAAARVSEIDRNRLAFYKRFFPNRPLTAEEFTLTLNSSALREEEMVKCILPLIKDGG